ncbi:hypothetical protein FACS1894191_2220 [Clostridia bacterium]|nr:hypothetical protein FACS1894191_2220 [Clostridia bacterium]
MDFRVVSSYKPSPPGGVLLFKLRNTDDYNALLRAAGLGGISDPDLPASISVREITEILKLFGGKAITTAAEYWPLNENDGKTLVSLLKNVNQSATQANFDNLCTKDYVFKAIKG